MLPFVTVWLVDGFWKAQLSKADPAIFWTVDVVEWIVLPALSLWLMHRAAPLSPRDYGVAWPGTSRFFVALVLCTLTLAFANDFGADNLGRRIFGDAPSAFSFGKLLSTSPVPAFVGAVYLATTAAVCESVFLLALPWLWFSQGRNVSFGGKIAFALAASCVFALGHWENGWANALGALLFQLVAVAWYFRLRTLWPIIGAHFLIDLYLFGPK